MDTQNRNQNLRAVADRLPPTRKQIERDIAHRFNAFNNQTIGSHPEKMTCTIFDRYLAIVGEDAMTPIEKIVCQSGQTEIILAMRESVDLSLKTELNKIICELIQVEPLDSFCQLSLNTGRLMAFAILSDSPRFRVKQSRTRNQPIARESSGSNGRG